MTDLSTGADTGRMDLREELRAIGQVVERLAARFPALPHELVEQAVHAEYVALDGGRIREYVPVLVEHAAKERLRKHGDPAYT